MIRHSARIACALLAMLASGMAIGSEMLSDSNLEALVSRAEAAISSAENATDEAERTAAYDDAIAAYRGVLDAGTENAAIFRNIGTVFLLKGDVGRAVANLRRAERLDPRDPRVRESLAAARAMVRTEVSPGVRTRTADRIFFWRGLVGRSTLAWIGASGWALLWIGLAWRLVSRQRGVPLAIIGGAVFAIAFGSLVGEQLVYRSAPAGVIVQDSVVGYRGPSDGVYEPTFEEPIRAGVEASVIEQRDGWARLRLRSGAETWVRAWAIEMV